MMNLMHIKIYQRTAVFILCGSLILTSHFVCAQPVDPITNATPIQTGSDARTDTGTAMPYAADQSAPSKSTTEAATSNTIDAVEPKSAAARLLDAISKHPDGRDAKRPDWKLAQDRAVLAARQGRFGEALPILDQLRKDHPTDAVVTSDYATVLAWAGQDSDAVAAYKTLPTGARPDYLLDAIGHSYRNLHQPEEALAVYRLALVTYPDNQSFMAGEILSLLETNYTDEAVALAQKANNTFKNPSEPLTVAITQALHVQAVELARGGHYKEALAAFAKLHATYPNDNGITGDYVACLSWAGHDTEAVALFGTLPRDTVADYVLDAAAHSYRNLRQPKQALDLYQAALDKSPENTVYAIGVIYSLSDLGRSDEALKVAKAQLEKHPEKPEALVKAYIYVERRRAIDLARAGHYEQALALLRELRAKYPNDGSEVMDYIAVSSWAGHDKDAVHEYQKIIRQPMPDYVLEAVGHSYRALHQSEQAITVYRRGLKQSPRNEIFAAGEIRCLDDVMRYSEGEQRAKKFTKSYGDHLEVLLAGGEAANFNEDHVEALNFYERANAIAPKNTESLRGLVHAEDTSGAPHLALKLADKHPGLMKDNEYRAIIGNADQRAVRWGTLEPAGEATRFAETDQALATLDAHIGQWTAKNDPSVYPSIIRTRFDRLIALRDRVRMQDVIDGYNALVEQGVEVPNFALVAVGDAYLYVRQPEIARDIFLKILRTEPTNFEARRLLAYSYLECEQYDEAKQTADKLVEDEPKWIYLKGEPERQTNPERATAELDAGQIRGFSSEMQEGDDLLSSLVASAPHESKNRDAKGTLDMMRGWPRAALQEYQIALALQEGHHVQSETGIAMANLALQNFRETDAALQSLTARFPEDSGVRRANRLWQVHNMAELDAHAGYNFTPTGGGANSPRGGGFDVGAEIYSSPLDYNWRLFAGQDFTHEREPAAEGRIDYARSNVGVEYRNGDVTASAGPTINEYNKRQRIGLDGKGTYTFNDQWSAGIGAALFSATTPLRALNAGVTANEFDVNTTWRQSEARKVTVTASALSFSDGNFRTLEAAEYIQRLYTDPIWQLDGEVNTGLSQNSKDENRLYYNPSSDLSALAGLRLTQSLYHRYETQWQHSLLVMPGLYAQANRATTGAWLIRYEHRLLYNDTTDVGAGVNYAHQAYDGSSQNAVSVTMNVKERF